MVHSPAGWTRPFLWLVVVFLGGMAIHRTLAWEVSVEILGGVAFILLTALLLGLFPGMTRCRSPAVPLLLFFALGVLTGEFNRIGATPPVGLEGFLGRPSTLFHAEIASPPDYCPDKVRLAVNLRSALVEGRSIPLTGGVLLTIASPETLPLGLFPGDSILLPMTLKRFQNFDNPGGFDYRRYQAEQGLFARAYLPNDRLIVKVASAPGFDPLKAIRISLDRFRQRALLWIRANLSSDTAAFYAALLLGYQHLVPNVWQEHLNRAGVTHLLSISGLHLGLVSLAVFWLVRLLARLCCPSLLGRVPDQHLALGPALLAAALYACISGLSAPPIWRSMIMLTICLVAAMGYFRPDPFSVLSAAALIIVVLDPASLWQVSFQLTFVCMFAIFAVYPRFSRWSLSGLHPSLTRDRPAGKVLAPFEEAFWVSIAVNLVVLPLTVYYFHGLSLAGLLANIVMVPLTGFLVIPLGLFSLAVFAASPGLALPILGLGAWFLERLEQLLLWFSHLSWAYFWVGTLSIPALLGFYAGLLFLLSPLQRSWKLVGLGLGLVLCLGTLCWNRIHTAGNSCHRLTATVVDVGQGSSTLVRFPDGQTMLVDGGGFFDESYDIGRWVLAPLLWHLGIGRLDYVVLSHDHPDHRGGLRFVLSHFNVGSLWESGIAEHSRNRSELADIAQRRGIPVLQCPEVIGSRTIGGSRVSVIHPTPQYLREDWRGDNLNDVSLVLVIDFGTTRLVLPGDVVQAAGRLHLPEGPETTETLLVAPHHGSESSNPPSLFDRLQPLVVVFSCGLDNWFGFPAPSVLDECARRGIAVFRTDRHGAVEAVSDGLRWRVEAANRTREAVSKVISGIN